MLYVIKKKLNNIYIINLYFSRIVSPKCLLICFLNGEPIPEGKSPIYTTAMRGMCICVSGVTPELKVHTIILIVFKNKL